VLRAGSLRPELSAASKLDRTLLFLEGNKVQFSSMDCLWGKVTHAAANRGLVFWALLNSTPCVMIIPFAAGNMGSWVWCNVNTGHEKKLAVADLKIECVGSIMIY
jgi:hypothetical protein